ncbi:MAG: hypothetical protein KAW66_05875, partial [Candidatus Lokiarchaeota archaeon]|nr:hypothetical protein [Candidatus Lokiarchaeota archaeon]
MKKIHSFYLIITLVFLMMLPILLPLNNTIREDQLIIKTSGETKYDDVSWLNNSQFEDPIEYSWFPTIDGDESDVDTSTSPNQANMAILGEEFIFEVIADPPDGNWMAVNNPRFPRFPDNNFTDSAGLNVFHYWDELEAGGQTHNTPSVHWKRHFTMPVNMSDYIITSASVQAIFNATVTVSPYNTGGIDCPGDPGDSPLQFSTGDYARFYVLISDPDNTYEYEVAYNQTINLGQDSPAIPSYPDTLMVPVPQDVLIAYLTAIFKENNFNFTITLGIDIYCEDNEDGYDRDRWNSLIIRSLNFTFAYRKKIDQFTSVSWSQVGRKVEDLSIYVIEITDANLNFEYKIDQTWTSSSPNSELRVLINNNLHSETVKLSRATDSFQEAKIGGYDVTPLILKDVNITLSIQVYLADEFGLENVITVSITNATLLISYIEYFPDPEPWIFTGLFIISVIGAGVLA